MKYLPHKYRLVIAKGQAVLQQLVSLSLLSVGTKFGFVGCMSARSLLTDYKKRANRKKKAGFRLTSVEAHIARLPGRRSLGPSFLECSREVLTVFILPLPVIAILSLLVFSEVSSFAGLTASAKSELTSASAELEQITAVAAEEFETKKPPVDSNFAANALSQFSEFFRWTTELNPTTRVSSSATQPSAELPEHAGTIEFITGVISVYYPVEKNPAEIAKHIVEVSIEEKVDPLYVAALISAESSFRTKARSSVGATGLMQLRMATAKEVFTKMTGKKKRPVLTDPRTNVRLGISYLKYLEKMYGGDKSLALAAYNWGPGNVGKVNRKQARFPKSVRKYADTILARTARWNRHFDTASDHTRGMLVQQS